MEASREVAPAGVQCYETNQGAMIYRIPLQLFPMLAGYIYLVLVKNPDGRLLKVLIDTGSGYGEANQQLEQGLQSVSESARQRVSLQDLDFVLITHGHIDHFGGLTYVHTATNARVGVHELDLRNLTNYEERLTIVSRRLDDFLIEAGVSEERRRKLIEMYRFTKSLYRSTRVDFTYEAVGMQVGPFKLLHTPGHSAGHVVIRLHDVLFSGDHVLDQTSPHQAPERLTLSTGLDHYLKSLAALESWADGIRLTLGGHKEPIIDLPGRLQQIRELHRQRLCQVIDLLAEPRTTAQVSQDLFGEVQGYNVLLALEETGAHIEYLHQRGLLGIDNLAQLEGGSQPTAIRYKRLTGCDRIKLI